jgi:hypothetical protein
VKLQLCREENRSSIQTSHTFVNTANTSRSYNNQRSNRNDNRRYDNEQRRSTNQSRNSNSFQNYDNGNTVNHRRNQRDNRRQNYHYNFNTNLDNQHQENDCRNDDHIQIDSQDSGDDDRSQYTNNRSTSNNQQRIFNFATFYYLNTSKFNLPSHVFTVDSCTGVSICKDFRYFIKNTYKKFNNTNIRIQPSFGKTSVPLGCGTIRINLKCGFILEIHNVLYMPDITANVIKLPRDKPFKIVIDEYNVSLVDKHTNNSTIIGFRRTDELYQFETTDDIEIEHLKLDSSSSLVQQPNKINLIAQSTTEDSTSNEAKLIKLHYAFGHPSEKIMRQIAINHDLKYTRIECDVCKVNNLVRTIPKKRTNCASQPMQSLCLDLAFTKFPSYDEMNYFIVIVDEFSTFVEAIPIVHKSDAFDRFVEWYKITTKLTNRSSTYITTDNGLEFVNYKFKEFTDKNNVVHRRTVPYHSFQNLAERYIRNIKFIACKLLNQSNLQSKFWSDAVRYASFSHNYRPNIKNNNKTPASIFMNFVETRKLILFGSLIYFIMPSEKRQT